MFRVPERRLWHLRLTLCCALMAAGTGCAPAIQVPVTQFGSANTTTVSAEKAFLASVDAVQTRQFLISIIRSRSVSINTNDADMPSAPEAAPYATPLVETPAAAAIDSVLNVIGGYGQALTNLATDTAGATAAGNVSALGQAVEGVNARALAPLGAKGLPANATVGDLVTAVNDIGNLVVADLVARDVQGAAKQMEKPLGVIRDGLEAVNAYYAKAAQQRTTTLISNLAAQYKMANDYASRSALLQQWIAAAQDPVSAAPANTALDALVAANSRIAAAGAPASLANIQAAVKAADDALTAYRAILKQ